MSRRVEVLVLRAAGINCERELVHAFELAGADHVDLEHVRRIAEEPARLERASILAIPGGFSYGDDVAAGRILGIEIMARLGESLTAFVARGGLVFGVCNGFQVLVSTGLLPGYPEDDGRPTATLAENECGSFVDRWTVVETMESCCLWAPPPGTRLELPVAHAEGRLLLDQRRLNRLETDGQIVFRYTDGTNPSGTTGGITGITDPTGRILGLMPHPERHIRGLQHPSWTRRGLDGKPDGLQIFEAGVSSARSAP